MKGPPAPPPHGGQRVATAGRPVASAKVAMLLVHGRGATAESILELADVLDAPDLAYLAPQASGNTWYPYSFMAPVVQNEPGRSSGLAVLDALVRQLEADGIPSSRIFVVGFSQGACLALEFAARHPRRYAGVAALTGGLIGPPDALTGYAGDLAGTPVLLGAGDPDPHVPWRRVEESARLLERLGAAVTVRRYPGMGHTVVDDELQWIQREIEAVVQAAGI